MDELPDKFLIGEEDRMANPTILAPQVQSELLKTIDKLRSVDEDQVNQSCFLQSSEFFRAAIADVMEEVLGLFLE